MPVSATAANPSRLLAILEGETLAARLVATYIASTPEARADALQEVIAERVNEVRDALEQSENQLD